jgi:hypothetical protein
MFMTILLVFSAFYTSPVVCLLERRVFKSLDLSNLNKKMLP